MPVTMPGRAMGSTSKSDTTSWPKKRLRAMAPPPGCRAPWRPASPAQLPPATAGWYNATSSGRLRVTSNHLRVSPGGGNW